MKIPEADDLGGGLVPDQVGSLNLRPEVVNGFLSVRQKHSQLQAELHQVMREIALPRCREIGNELLAIKAFYPKGKKGSASDFYRHAQQLTGLSKPSVANYIQISENWARLIDYMADLPEGASPVTSLRGALEAIRAMNRPLKPAASDDAIDVDAEAVEGDDQQALPAGKRTNYAASARKAMETQFTALKVVKVLTPLHRDRLDKIQEMLQILLDDIDRLEGDAAVPTVVETIPVEPPAPAPSRPTLQTMETAEWSGDDEPTTRELPKLMELYPFTTEGREKLEADIVEQGSGAKLGLHLGNTSKNPSRWISDHRKRQSKALES